jgi:predicted methyltransferase
MGPLLTSSILAQLRSAREAGEYSVGCSLDLGKSQTTVHLEPHAWTWSGQRFPFPSQCKERTIYYWEDADFRPVARYTTSLIKLVPTEWGAPTFEIDGIKMLPTARLSPYTDAQNKVRLIDPAGKRILDTCGGLGYFADCCLALRAAHVHSFELNPDVLWLRSLNPWSPDHRWKPKPDASLTLVLADVSQQIGTLPAQSVDAILHDPPRFGIAGELYSQRFYDQLAKVLRRRGKLFHYVGTPNKLTTGRDVAAEVAARLRRAGFAVSFVGDGIVAKKSAS